MYDMKSTTDMRLKEIDLILKDLTIENITAQSRVIR